MADALDQLLDEYDKGSLSRRQLLKGLALVTGGALAGNVDATVEAQTAPIIPVQQINHLNISAKDVKRSAEFYRVVYGAKIQLDAAPGAMLMSFPGATGKAGCWISINAPTKRPDTDNADGTPGHYTHIGVGVNADPTEFPRISAEIARRFPDVKPPNVPKMANNHPVGPFESYVFDPDGLAIQLTPASFDAANMARMKRG